MGKSVTNFMLKCICVWGEDGPCLGIIADRWTKFQIMKKIGQRLQMDFVLGAIAGLLVVATYYAALRSLRPSLVP